MLKQTSVMVEADELEVLKSLGINLSAITRDAMTIALGLTSKNIVEYERDLKDVDEKLLILNAKREGLLNKIKTAKEAEKLLTVQEVRQEKDQQVLTEFHRCMEKIVLRKQLTTISHLADVSGKQPDAIRQFLNRETIPDDDEILTFLRS